MNKIDLATLSAADKKTLLSVLKQEEEAEKNRIFEERQAFKDLKDETMRRTFIDLQKLSEDMEILKNIVFDRFDTIIKMKDDLFKVKSDRQTDTFTTEDGKIQIKLGNWVYEGWDDTVEVGIQKVREYLKTLAKDENSANLVETVMNLLAKDRKGNLKANKVLELEKLAVKSKNADFIDGLQIIKDAYRPTPSCQFIEVRFKDEHGKEKTLPLSMSAFDFV